MWNKKKKQEQNKNSQLKYGIFLSYINTFVHNLLALIYTPIMLKELGTNEYGLYTMCAALINSLSIIHMGFGAAYAKFYIEAKQSADSEDVQRINGMFLIVFSIISGIAIICTLFMAYNTELLIGDKLNSAEIERAQILITLMGISLAVTLFNASFSGLIAVKEKFVYQRAVVLIKNIVTPLISMVLLVNGYKSVAIIVVMLLINIFGCISDIMYCVVEMGERYCFSRLQFSRFKELSNFTLFIFFMVIADQISWQVDKIVLGKLCGPIITAIYGVGANINTYYQQISNNISTVFASRINLFVVKKKRDEINTLFIRIGRIQFALLLYVLSAWIIFGREFIVSWWSGEDYANAYYVALILMISSIIPLSQSVTQEIQKAYNKHKVMSCVYIVLAIVNLAISIPLSYVWGEIGAALGTLIVMILGNIIIANWYYCRELYLNVKGYFFNISVFFRSFIITGLSYYVFNVKYGSYMGNKFIFILEVMLFSVAYGIVLWISCLNEEEKRFVINTFNRLRFRK